MKSWNRLDWFIVLSFAALVVLFYWRILTPNPANRQSFPPGDFYAQFWAFTTFDVHELSAGRLPLWNPYTLAGSPFWADVQAAVFYPFSLLTLLLSAPWGFSAFALELEAIFHIWLAAVFMYLFVREITKARSAAVIAALTFAFSGYLTGYPSQQLAVLEVDVWLPLILFFLVRAAPERMKRSDKETRTRGKEDALASPSRLSAASIHYLLWAGVALGLALLAGHPQSTLITGYITIAYLLFLWLGGKQGSRPAESHSRYDPAHRAVSHSQFAINLVFRILNTLPALLIFLVTGLALAAIQFIPAAEYTLRSVRAEGAYETMSGGFPITDVIQVLLPGQVSVYSPLYVGVVGLILVVWVILTAPNRQIIFWAIVALITLLISFGGNTFLYSLLYHWAPGFSIFRGQERWAFATAFSLSVLAGYGFNQLVIYNYQLTKNTHRSSLATQHSSSLFRLTKYLFFLALLFDLLFFYGLNNTGWSLQSQFYGLLGASTLLTIVAALAWILWAFAPRLSPALLTVFTSALICFDLFSVNWQTNLFPQPPEWHTRIPTAVQAIKADAAQSPDEPYRVYNEFRVYDNYGVPFEVQDLWGASPLRPSRYDEFLAPPMPIERTWELLNVKYVITWREELYLPSTIIYQEPAADGATIVHRLDQVGPRAWLVDQIEIADDNTILQKIADPDFDRWRIALLEQNSESATLRMGEFLNTSQSSTQPPGGTIHSSQFPTPGHIIYEISTTGPALLILSETHYPGWQVTIDGQPASLLRADYILRAVPVPAGDHTIELTFRPLSFTIGAVISGLALAIILVAGVGRFIKRPQDSK